MKNQKLINRIIGTALSVLMIGSLAACGADNASDADSEQKTSTGNSVSSEYKTVNLGYPGTNGCCDGLFGYIDVKGILEEELNKAGYTAVSTGFSNGGAGINEALGSGAIEIGVYTDIPGIVARSSGLETTVFAVNSSYTGLEVVTKDENINSIEDLKGKKIGYTVGNVNHCFLVTALQSAGLTINDVEAVTMTSAEGVAALETGDIDALSAVEIYTGELQFDDEAYHVVASTRNNPEWSNPYILVGLDSFLESEPEAAEAVVKALIRGKEEAMENPDDFYQTLADAHGFDFDFQKYLEDVDNGTFDTKDISISDEVIEMVRADYEFLRENDLAANEFDVDAWFDNSIYEKAVG